MKEKTVTFSGFYIYFGTVGRIRPFFIWEEDMSLGQLSTTEAYMETSKLAKEMLETLENKLMEATGTSSMVNAAISRLQSVINEIEVYENRILQAFGISSGENAEKELQDKFNKFYSDTGLSNLSGVNVEKVFLEEYRVSVSEDLKETQDYIDNYIVPHMIEILKTKGTEATKEELGKAFNKVLKNQIITCDLKNGKVVTTRSEKSVDFNQQGVFRILASNLTKEQQNRVNKLRSYIKKNGNDKVKIDSKVEVGQNEVIASIHSEWYELTEQGKSASQIKKLIEDKKITETQFDNINIKITDLICSQVKDGELVRKYIKKMLDKDPYIFFVGKNINDITGILGEISAVTAVSELLENVDPDKVLNWVANEKVDHKKLSIDILLKEIGNIQVKNTSKDIAVIPEIDINFAQGNVDTILQKLGEGYDWNSDIIISVLESESFNVPAKRSGKKLKETTTETTFKNTPSDWDDFVETYNLMTDIIARTHTFLTTYAADFLYISGPSDFKNQLAVLDYSLQGMVGKGIHLYITAGVPHLASSQLKIIQEDLRKLEKLKEMEAHFNIKTSFGVVGKEKLPYNYVTYKNRNLKERKAKITSAMSMAVN